MPFFVSKSILDELKDRVRVTNERNTELIERNLNHRERIRQLTEALFKEEKESERLEEQIEKLKAEKLALEMKMHGFD